MTLYNLETGTDGAWIDWRYPPRIHHTGGWDPACALCNPTMNADPLTVPETDEEPWATVEDDRRSGGVIVWMLGAIVVAVVVAWLLLADR